MFATVDSKQRRRKRNKNLHKERRQIAPWQINQCSSDMYWKKCMLRKSTSNAVENIWIYLICCSVNVSHWQGSPRIGKFMSSFGNHHTLFCSQQALCDVICYVWNFFVCKFPLWILYYADYESLPFRRSSSLGV